MADRSFVHLHCHSHFSLLDGAGSIDRLVKKAADSGMNALALTDHGNLHGALEFYRKAKAADINPVIGYEAYIAPKTRFHREPGRQKDNAYHLTLLARNRIGFRNLLKLASAAYLEGFYFKPRIDKELLTQFNEGIICLSGCVSGELSRTLLGGGADEARIKDACEIAGWFQNLFGDRYFVEVQNNGLEIQQLAMEASLEVAQRVGAPVVATSDAHYVDREDAEVQDVLLCINTGARRSDADRMKMEGREFFLRTPDEMYAAFPSHADAVARSQEIADSVDIELELGARHFPVYQLPDERPPEQLLRDLCLEGLKDRYRNVPHRWEGDELHPDVLARLDRELGVINKLGFPNYFLIVWDFVRHAREQGVEATARGSGVGSLVAYATHMSHVCPLEYDLLFERFLDESRLEAPDIDIDFDKERRGEIIQYVKDKYGEENVAQIGTFGTLAARAAIRDVGRALGMAIPEVDRVVAMVPDQLGISLDKAIETSDELQKAYDNEPQVRELLDLARKIEGLARNVGTHAAAVVIADRPLTEYVPLCRVTGKEDVITQWSMNDVEAAGLLKMDFLGLRNLTILSKAVQLIEQTTGERVDPYAFPMDDPATFALLQRGETKGIFQLESGGIRDLLQKMKPDAFRDIIATNALYRPGPLEGGMVDDYVQVKHGRKQAEYKHPVMKDVLEETHGVMVYQEQVMRILNRLGGIPLSDAYKCIKAISKKKLPIIAKYKEQFIEGSVESGMKKKEADDIFSLIEKFAGYGFNKSHSTAYAKIAFMTAYLKAHYPVEFMAALLSADIPGRNFKRKDALVEHREDCQRMGVEVLAPDVNRSHGEFTVADGKIAFGLEAVKGCGGPASAALVAAREEGGPFASLFDFCERVDPQIVNRATVESLIKAGAFDATGAHRAQLFAALDKAVQAGASMHADRRSGQRGLFDDMQNDAEEAAAASLPNIPEWEEREKLAYEKEVLGCYFSSHPLAEFEKELAAYCSHRTSQLGELPHRGETVVGGIISSLKYSNTKNARPGSTATRYVMFDLEDVDGVVRCILWPDDFVLHGEHVQADRAALLRAVVDRRPGAEETNLIINEVIPIEQAAARFSSGARIRLSETRHDAASLNSLRDLLSAYPGELAVKFEIEFADARRLLLSTEQVSVAVDADLKRRVDELLGPGAFHFTSSPMKRSGGAPPQRGRRRAPQPVGG